MRAVLDPFHPDARGACIPMADGGSTFKFMTDLDTILEASPTKGGILILLRPAAASDNTVAQAYDCDPGDTIATVSGGAELTHWTAYGSPFVESNFGSGSLEQRCVGWGSEIQQAGAPLYASGTAVQYTAITGGTVSTTESGNSITKYTECRIKPVPLMYDEPLRDMYDLENTFPDKTNWYSVGDITNCSGTHAGTAINATSIAYIPKDANGKVSVRLRLRAHWETRGRTATPIGTLDEVEPAAWQKAAAFTSEALRIVAHNMPSGEWLYEAAQRSFVTGGTFAMLSMPLLRGAAAVLPMPGLPYRHRQGGAYGGARQREL